ncbi:MAG: hypothetical protein MZU97_04715 [Bacillus subtilis]|nr:hypothetical protein [Bacillus subtilis]
MNWKDDIAVASAFITILVHGPFVLDRRRHRVRLHLLRRHDACSRAKSQARLSPIMIVLAVLFFINFIIKFVVLA